MCACLPVPYSMLLPTLYPVPLYPPTLILNTRICLNPQKNLNICCMWTFLWNVIKPTKSDYQFRLKHSDWVKSLWAGIPGGMSQSCCLRRLKWTSVFVDLTALQNSLHVYLLNVHHITRALRPGYQSSSDRFLRFVQHSSPWSDSLFSSVIFFTDSVSSTCFHSLA